MIRSLFSSAEGHVSIDMTPDQLSAVLQAGTGTLWLDIEGEETVAAEAILRDTFGFHPLAVDDALQEVHVPKLDSWEHYLYLVLHTVNPNKDHHDPVETLELDLFLSRNFLVTYRTGPMDAVNRVWKLYSRDDRRLQKGTAHLLYRLTDELAADYLLVIEQIDDSIDQIEDQIFGNPTPAVLEQLFSLKRTLLRLRRIMAPQRDVLHKLSREEYAMIDPSLAIFFRDVHDHLARLHDIIESRRDLVGSALDTYLSVVNNRMNDVMKALTIITVLFMPLSVVVGFFGMNFFQPALEMDMWTGRLAFGLTLLGMALLPAAMYLWLRRRGQL